MGVAADLIPQVPPPDDNPGLDAKGRQGILIEEMARVPTPEKKSPIEESIKCRFDRLCDWMRWQLVLTGHFKVSNADGSFRETKGDHDIEIGDLKTLIERIEAERKRTPEPDPWCFYVNSHTRRQHLESKDHLLGDGFQLHADDAQLIVVDAGYMDGSDFQQFLPDDVIVLVKGTDPVGHMYATMREVEDKDLGTLQTAYVSMRQVVMPELTAPERILICRL